ncbi:SMI1/KNR4 family protein [Streptomyces sp. DSM 44915]|uniref:SMI1/KNR4 family protein n=1 Tax=Streptomyces chisholmiae TaxID=3075540 RepID=A0ABU2JSG0_9ACTN|nr:SMI1/KNR4 family protein [Streptomyces sp. DSM 44915]MDT0267681.1 SMI1/KNR4 family protein [Streptomyces sp. DSM 44915]
MSVREELLRLVPPPEGVGVRVDWQALEEELGSRLPSDYKWLVERYGPGSFDNFLHVLQPTSPAPPIRLVSSADRAAEILDQLREKEDIPFATEELLPVAKTDNGDTIYWVTRPEDDPDAWTLTGNGARNTRWPRFDGGIVAFLVATLSGAHKMAIFPNGFPTERPVFVLPPE